MKYTDIKSIEDVKLTTDYIPYITKVAECKNIAEVTSHKEVAGKKIFSLDSPIRHLWYIMKMVDLYTDVEFDVDKIAEAYDALTQNGVLDVLFGGQEPIIPSGELVEFQQVMDMVMDDMYENERATSAILGGLKDTLGMVLNTTFDAMEEAVEEESPVKIELGVDE